MAELIDPKYNPTGFDLSRLGQDTIYELYFVLNSKNLTDEIKTGFLQDVIVGVKDVYLDNPLLANFSAVFQKSIKIQTTSAENEENVNFKCQCGSTKGSRKQEFGMARADEIPPVKYTCFVCGKSWTIR